MKYATFRPRSLVQHKDFPGVTFRVTGTHYKEHRIMFLYSIESVGHTEFLGFDCWEDQLSEPRVLDKLRPILAQKQVIEAQIQNLMPLVFEDFKQRLDLATTREHVRVLQEELDWWDSDEELTTARRLLISKYSEGKLQ